MSIRTHAPHCAKTRALIESEEDSTERRHVECTCGATYVPGVEAQRDEARRMAEAGFRYGVENGEDPEEMCPPWLNLDLWFALCGALEVDR